MDMWTHTKQVFTERLRPGTVEFSMLVYQPVAYWLVACFYDLLDHLKLPLTERYKVVRRDPGRSNTVTRRQVILRVLLQQLIQAALNLGLFILDADMCSRYGSRTFMHQAVRFVLGLYVMDTWQYWIHRLMHNNTFLYKHMHSVHHTLMIPYAYGALYNSILEGLLLDTMGGVVTHYVAGLDCPTAVCVFTFGNIKTVLDHCNYRGPINPLHNIFPNGAAYHDIHHDIRGTKANFSQPFFTHWDWLLNTFMDPAPLHFTVEELRQQQEEKKAGEPKKQR
ncbi:Sphingoid base hydroxylase 2 [Tetrabaena socialis]|uniref:Sphingoid base hydroxylase 2 n=1 Tax=Tetrabaena socialis TaxID=47790 RepID=A0A2J8ACX9_9CHLO|nr:Sphingoid base hydroxylase 2 [Tetrabaena socialis]|eukprot:PNH10366.1 Sphingoid base hydroxylase 2 [Tetrabaena socialis]